MSRKHHSPDPLAVMAEVNPVSAAELAAAIGEADLGRELARATALGEAGSGTPAEGREPRRHRAAGLRLRAGFGLAAVLALGALAVFAGWLGGAGGGSPEFAAAAIRVAEANPRLLVTAPGWKIVRADEFEPDSGELEFSDGSHRFSINWYPARYYGRYLRDRADVSRPERGSLLGQRATTVEYSPREYATMLAPQGSVFVEVRGMLGSKPAYERILASLRPVDIETWLGAMPPSTVRPEARAEAVERMLRGIPLPPGFDATALQNEDSIANKSMLATKVGNAVACGWARSWIAARAAGDRAAATRAIAALASWSRWPIVRRTKVPWFSNYAVVVKEMRAGHLNRGYSGYEVLEDGRTFGFGPAWKLTLGCKGTYRREVDALPTRP